MPAIQTDLPVEHLSFREELQMQRWDDHRYYHQSRINQSLHLLSSMCFMSAYVLVFFSPGAAVLLGWLLAMVSRQAGHFFFEPRHYDQVNHATQEHKEDIKIGYNLHRKRILHAIWALLPVALYFNPSFFGLVTPASDLNGFMHNVALLWLALAAGAILFRVFQLARSHNARTGIIWAVKIITDPFNDFKTYLKSPLYLMRGQLFDPMHHVQAEGHAARTSDG